MSENGAQRYRVEHHTAYRYSEPVMLSHQQLHLTPRPLDYQQCSAHEVVIRPNPTSRREFIDAFGNPVAELAIETAHSALDIVARTAVEVTRRPPVEFHKTPAWETVREALAYRAAWHPGPAILDATQYLFESPYARVKRSLRAYAADCFETGRPILAAATALMEKIHGEFKFDAAATNVTTPVMKFFEQKCGVCQDFTHLMISCLRSTGLAARYVSGYLLTRRRPASRAASAPMFPTRGYLYSSPAVVGSTSIRPTMFSLRRNILPLDGAATSPTSRRCAASLTAAASKPSKSR